VELGIPHEKGFVVLRVLTSVVLTEQY